MKNFIILILCFCTLACSAQKKISNVNIKNQTYKVVSETLKQQYKVNRYINKQNKFSDSKPGYASDYMEQYVDQNLVKIDEKKVLAITKSIMNGKLKADKTQTLIINFFINPFSGELLELSFSNFYTSQPIPSEAYFDLESQLQHQITADIKTDRYQKYLFVKRTVIMTYADLAREE